MSFPHRPWWLPRLRRRHVAVGVAAVAAVGALTAPSALARVIPPVQSTPGDAYVTSAASVPLTGGLSTLAFLVLPAGTYTVDGRAVISTASPKMPAMDCDWTVAQGSTLSTPADQAPFSTYQYAMVPISFQTVVTITPQAGNMVGSVGLECWAPQDAKASGVVLTALRTNLVNVQTGP